MAKKANGDGTYRKLASGNWQVQAMDGYDANGKKKYVYFTASTKGEVKQLLLAYRSKQEKKDEPADAPETNSSEEFAELAEAWYRDHATQVRPSTYAGYRYTLNILEKHLADTSVDSILPMQVNALLDELTATPYSRSCVTKCRAMLIQILDYAEANQMILSNPARKAKTMRIFEMPDQVKDAFTEEEVALLRKHLPHDLLGNSICLLLGTGIRVQELLALRIEDFAADLSSVRIDKAIQTVNGKPALGPTKSRRSKRIVPIPEEYRPYAAYLLRHGGKAFIWTSGRENLLYSVGTFRRKYYKALEKIPGVRLLPPHCCRHTYSTMLQTRGVPIETVARILGHESIQTTENYTHLPMTALAAAAEVLNR